ncbi:hypothetical protein CJ483_22200 [Bacillus sp. PK3_68]|nr:hypothetical protein CJ483_22200 [Bacillus sp. PK3_68]
MRKVKLVFFYDVSIKKRTIGRKVFIPVIATFLLCAYRFLEKGTSQTKQEQLCTINRERGKRGPQLKGFT